MMNSKRWFNWYAAIWAVMFFIMLFINGSLASRYAECSSDKQVQSLLNKREEDVKKIIIEYIRLHNSSIGKITASRWANYYIEYAKEYELDPLLLAAISAPESNFNRHAVSYAGAIGIMQIMPFWVEHLDFVESPEDLYDPEINIRAGAYILAHYIEECGNVRNGVMCYNGGPRALDYAKPSTIHYVKNVMDRYNRIDSI